MIRVPPLTSLIFAVFASWASRWTAPVSSAREDDYEFMYTHSLAENYLQYVLQVPAFESALSKTSKVLQRVAFSIQKEVEKKLESYLDDFHVESIDTGRIIFDQEMEKEFEDGIINWGRIMTIFAFGSVLLTKLPQEQIAMDVGAYKQVSSFVAEFITNNTGEWIRQNGGWVCVITYIY